MTGQVRRLPQAPVLSLQRRLRLSRQQGRAESRRTLTLLAPSPPLRPPSPPSAASKPTAPRAPRSRGRRSSPGRWSKRATRMKNRLQHRRHGARNLARQSSRRRRRRRRRRCPERRLVQARLALPMTRAKARRSIPTLEVFRPLRTLRRHARLPVSLLLSLPGPSSPMTTLSTTAML